MERSWKPLFGILVVAEGGDSDGVGGGGRGGGGGDGVDGGG